DPLRRYPTANDLADDLRRFLDGRLISARPAPAWVRAGKWCRPHPAPAAALALTAVLFAGLAPSTPLLLDAFQAEPRAKGDAARAQAVAEQREREAKDARDDARRAEEEATETTNFLVRLFRMSDPLGFENLAIDDELPRLDDAAARPLLVAASGRVREQ